MSLEGITFNVPSTFWGFIFVPFEAPLKPPVDVSVSTPTFAEVDFAAVGSLASLSSSCFFFFTPSVVSLTDSSWSSSDSEIMKLPGKGPFPECPV